MKIGFFLPNATFDQPGTPEVGGIESFTFTVGEALQRLGHDVILFGGQPKAGRDHKATSLTLELHPYWETRSIPDLGTRFQRLIQRLHFGWKSRRAWSAQACDVMILAKPFDWPVAWFWKKSRPQTKVIMGFHGTDFFSGDRYFYSAVDAAFAVSRRVADLAEKRVGRRPTLIPNPVDIDFFQPGEKRAADQASWHVVASGRLVGWKGFAHLIEAVAQLRAQTTIPVHLSLAGDGPERANLEAQVQRLQLQKQVTFHGRLDHVRLREFLQSGDLYVAPSVGMEAFSIAALEAACVGLPLLLSSEIGLMDYLEKTEYLTYPAQDLAALAAQLQVAFQKQQEPEWLDRSARHQRLRARFSAESVAQKILHLVPA